MQILFKTKVCFKVLFYLVKFFFTGDLLRLKDKVFHIDGFFRESLMKAVIKNNLAIQWAVNPEKYEQNRLKKVAERRRIDEGYQPSQGPLSTPQPPQGGSVTAPSKNTDSINKGERNEKTTK